MEYLSKQFPRALAEIEKLMVGHGAKTHRDDQEWREHDTEDHCDHICAHIEEIRNDNWIDPDSNQPQLSHIACRALMALEVYLGGGVDPIQGVV